MILRYGTCIVGCGRTARMVWQPSRRSTARIMHQNLVDAVSNQAAAAAAAATMSAPVRVADSNTNAKALEQSKPAQPGATGNLHSSERPESFDACSQAADQRAWRFKTGFTASPSPIPSSGPAALAKTQRHRRATQPATTRNVDWPGLAESFDEGSQPVMKSAWRFIDEFPATPAMLPPGGPAGKDSDSDLVGPSSPTSEPSLLAASIEPTERRGAGAVRSLVWHLEQANAARPSQAVASSPSPAADSPGSVRRVARVLLV